MKIERRYPTPKLGAGGHLLDVPENQDFIRRLRATPSLTPVQLVRLSKAYRKKPALASLADHLLGNSLRMVAATYVGNEHGEPINRAMAEYWQALSSEDGS